MIHGMRWVGFWIVIGWMEFWIVMGLSLCRAGRVVYDMGERWDSDAVECSDLYVVEFS
jgi:hypothetical protein